jgi:VanZ family protein
MNKYFRLLVYSLVMAIIIFSAYVGAIPTRLHEIPFYDSAGHFVLYGFWGYFFGNAFSTPLLSIGNFRLQTGIAIAAPIAVTEEFLQQLSPMRTFSLYDLAFGLAGIALSCAILNFTRRQSAKK